MKLIRIDGLSFDHLAKRTRMTDRAKEMARAHLVAGHSYSVIADKYAVSEQRVGAAVSVIRREFDNAPIDTESAIVTLELSLPRTLATRLQSCEYGKLTLALDKCEADEQVGPGKAISPTREAGPGSVSHGG